ncbi:MAG: TonB-dependent receptor [Paludibacteraceae bacterium]|nr:TonB-dependent receptor [Paludibacteraceae bacterium]
MKQNILTLLFCLWAACMYADNLKISGTLIDKNSNEPFAYVNTALHQQSNNQLVTGALSDMDGKFELYAPAGKYTLTITFVGYKTVNKPITLSEEHPHVRLGKIILEEDTQLIKEIEVVGQKSAMQLDIDKKVFNVSDNILAEGASATDILENIPSVEVDTEGNVSLRNNSSVEIWINGKPSGLSDTDKGQVLEMLPAETIEKVELITNPSAKYNPEGSVGIINIVMKESHKGGYFGSVTAGANYQEGNDYPGGNLGLNFNYNQGKWDFFLNASGRHHLRTNSSYNNRTSFDAGKDTTYLNQTSNNINRFYNGFLRTGFTYRIDKQNEIGMSAFGAYNHFDRSSLLHYTSLDQNKDTTNTRNRTTNSLGDMAFYNATIDYKHKFVADKEEITANLNYFGRYRDNNSDYHNLYNNEGSISQISEYQTQNEIGHSASAQVDYFNKFTPNSKLEVGAKANFDYTNSQDRSFDATHTEIADRYRPFLYTEQIYALYASYGNKFDWFGFQLGVRGEETITQANDINRSYFQVFPSAYLSFELPKQNEIQLNYTRRINRPRGRLIDNYIDRSDPTNISYGNPWLMPEFSNNVEVNYLKTWDEHTLSAGLYYSYTENVIQRVSKLNSEGVMENTFENINYSHNAGIELIAKNRLFKNYLDLTTSVTGYYYSLGENEEYKIAKTETFSWNARVNANVKILSNLSAQVTAYYNAPRLVAQGTVDHRYGLNAGIKASFLNKALSVNFTVNDILNSRSNSLRTNYSDNFYQESANTSVGRSYRLSISYNFGNMRPKRNKVQQNNDMGGEAMYEGDMTTDF